MGRLVGKLSVRTRIIAIALIPVVGFVANGIAYRGGETEVGDAFATMNKAAEIADASREYKAALANMRIAARDFAARPSDGMIKAFEEAQWRALINIETVVNSLGDVGRMEIDSLRVRLDSVMSRFGEVVREQQLLGFTEDDGIRGRLQKSGLKVEGIINDNMSWVAELDAKRLLISLLSMRRYEADYRINRMLLIKKLFFDEYKKFVDTFALINGAPTLKSELESQVKVYTDTFAEWIASKDRIDPALAIIDIDTRDMMPAADQIVTTARERAVSASAALTTSQARTKNIIILVGCAAVLVGLIFSWTIGRSITRPLSGLATAMKQLAEGDTSARVPATRARDEIGVMARTVLVFRDTFIERERLAATQSETSRAREQRSEMIAATIARFEKSVDQVLAKVRDAAERLEKTSGNLNSTADAVSEEARTAESRVNAASSNVTAAAGSVEELAASIAEIATQANKSTGVASRAVSEGRRTAVTMTDLGNAASRIGEVVTLIQAIAGQTNLLALNATIEAARAGEAGRGFAVVASEVKSLAGQTARATEEIAGQIGAIQSAAADAAQAITQVNAIIEDMSTIAANVALTVEEQNSAVAAIAEGVNSASAEARTGAEAMSRVAGTSADARSTAADVKALADTLAIEAEGLEAEVRRFLVEVQAA
ncbi:MAG: HAMP domain-containing protein [Rhizobiales bacterium]|nr:HAMP domain-containing protein [Hyphomicrobiales bacterium]